MAEHFCKEHGVVFFKKGKMKGYAHPVVDDGGDPTGEWCNEPEEKAEKPQVARQGSTNESIEAQVAFKGMIELIVADRITIDSKPGQAAYNWAMSKLANWASMGEPPKDKPGAKAMKPRYDEPDPEVTKEEPEKDAIQPEQIERIKRAAIKYKEHTEVYIDLLKGAYKTSNYKELTALQAEDLIKRLDKGEGLEGIEPEEIPF